VSHERQTDGPERISENLGRQQSREQSIHVPVNLLLDACTAAHAGTPSTTGLPQVVVKRLGLPRGAPLAIEHKLSYGTQVQIIRLAPGQSGFPLALDGQRVDLSHFVMALQQSFYEVLQVVTRGLEAHQDIDRLCLLGSLLHLLVELQRSSKIVAEFEGIQ
jgi:hypothetical protein